MAKIVIETRVIELELVGVYLPNPDGPAILNFNVVGQRFGQSMDSYDPEVKTLVTKLFADLEAIVTAHLVATKGLEPHGVAAVVPAVVEGAIEP